ncbi:hypothetical protein ABZU32_02595 [Sphaerisporangium sp. NPDC005288]|uniref:hypothetical protein n=1 Tax=Sphaerisporangium sp. NPDC005288 TaxID=3155114 RepID=UPI0033A43A02
MTDPSITVTIRSRDDGTGQTIHDLLRWQVREQAGRNQDPSAVVLDTQTEALPASSESMIYRSMTDNMTRRLTGTATPTWRHRTPATA